MEKPSDDGSTEPRTMTKEETLDFAVASGIAVGHERGVVHPNNKGGRLLSEDKDGPERPGISIIFWQPEPGQEQAEAARMEWTPSHDGKRFLAFGLTDEAGRALLDQLADIYGTQLVPYVHNRE